jgi:uncharacterized protein (DUF58 family)
MPAARQTAELLSTIGRIRIRTRKTVFDLLAGPYRSAFRGAGMEFDAVREYVEGDDLRVVDWNVTARTGSPFVKTFREERERTVLLLADVSASTAFGSGRQDKASLAAEFCAVLALSAAGSQDRVGLVAFSDRIEHRVPARRGTRHALRVVRDVLSLEASGGKTDINAALEHLVRMKVKRAVVFLVSDFRDEGFEKNLMTAARRHDLVAVKVADQREKELPSCGLVRLRDPETGRACIVDAGSAAVRERFAAAAGRRDNALRALCARCGIDLLEIKTDEPFGAPLREFMQRRGRRLRR